MIRVLAAVFACCSALLLTCAALAAYALATGQDGPWPALAVSAAASSAGVAGSRAYARRLISGGYR